MESGCRGIGVELWKRAPRYVRAIMDMEEDRWPKICLGLFRFKGKKLGEFQTGIRQNGEMNLRWLWTSLEREEYGKQ